MSVAPFPDLDIELRRIALARTLRSLPLDRLLLAAARLTAYAVAGVPLTSLGPQDDAEALRRATLFLQHVAPALPLQPVDLAA